MEAYIRKLQHGDHLTSCHWRNNPEIWKYTGSRPDMVITEQIEEEWLLRVTQDPTSTRWAICIAGTDEYVGNVQLTDIKDGTAEFHIFIGNTAWWGKGIGLQATRLMVEEGFRMGLQEIYLYVDAANKPAVAIYERCGFEVTESDGNKLKMVVTLST